MKKQKKAELQKVLTLLAQVHSLIIQDIQQQKMDEVVKGLEDCLLCVQTLEEELQSKRAQKQALLANVTEYKQIISAIYLLLEKQTPLPLANIQTQLDRCLAQMNQTLTTSSTPKPLICFLPYKVSMWDSLASIYEAAAQDEHVDILVMPIPYFERTEDGSFGKLCYEGELFPTNVPITHYETVDLQALAPTVIYIHNPYDEHNYVTSVHPDYYASQLQELCDQLVYVPYFVLDEKDLGIEDVQYLANTPGVIYADSVVVQSAKVKHYYVESLCQIYGEQTRSIWQEKIHDWGSPKFDLPTEDIIIPPAWKQKYLKADGTKKKIILYNTTLGAMLSHPEEMLLKIADTLDYFEQLATEEVVFLWRPHPLMEATLQSMGSATLISDYRRLVARFKAQDFGIYDDTPDLNRALVLADAYYGDRSSLVPLCENRKIPVMIQNIFVKNGEE